MPPIHSGRKLGLSDVDFSYVLYYGGWGFLRASTSHVNNIRPDDTRPYYLDQWSGRVRLRECPSNRTAIRERVQILGGRSVFTGDVTSGD